MKPTDLKAFQKVIGTLHAMVDDFMTYGIAWYVAPDVSAGQTWQERRRMFKAEMPSILNPIAVRTFLKDCAKEQKRPFLYAITEVSTYGYIGYKTSLKIPRNKRLDAVAMTLMVGAEQAKSNYNRPGSGLSDGCALSHYADTRNNYFTFFGYDGRVIFEAFRESCATDPVLRIALNNTTPFLTKAA
jgi:hypothetical protein